MWRFYKLRRRWAVLRLTLRYDSTECAYCHCAFTPTGNRQRTIDHLTPSSKGGTWRIRNLVWACAACNRQKGDGDLTDFLWSDWLKVRRVIVQKEMAKAA